MQLFLTIVALLVVQVANAIPVADETVYTTSQLNALYLNTSNYLFQTSKRPNYLKIDANIGDKIDLLCPKNDLTTNTNENHYLILYKVDTKYEFDNCFINKNNENSVLIVKCDKPLKQIKYTMHFIKFSPVPNAIEFEQNREYYFLTTSTGTYNGLHTQQGGLCSKHNLKFSIKIQPEAYDDQDYNYNQIAESQKLERQELDERMQLQEEQDQDNFLSFILTGVLKSTNKQKLPATTTVARMPTNMKFIADGFNRSAAAASLNCSQFLNCIFGILLAVKLFVLLIFST
jgi:hypothetical protein